MSRILNVLKNKNRVQKMQRARRNAELGALNKKTSFTASLSDNLKGIERLLDSDQVKSVKIRVGKDNLGFFNEAVYSEVMKIYNIEQIEPDLFELSLKEI